MENTFRKEDLDDAARRLGIETAAVKAVIDVETGSRGGILPDGRGVILFERHVFWRRLNLYGINPVDNFRGNEDILHLEWTCRNYKGGAGEYERLERAMKIHRNAAWESASWGVFQIMGFNYRKCGCADVAEFVERMGQGMKSQLEMWVQFMKHEGLDECLKHRQWSLFAFRYNGRSYKANRYDKRLKNAYEKYRKEASYEEH